MLIDTPDPSQVTLQIVAQEPDGTPKTDVTGGTVRVYHMVGAVETEVLAATPLVQVGATTTWRYLWSPGALAADAYVAEYTLTDSDANQFIGTEDIVVEDFAQEATVDGVETKVDTANANIVLLQADLEIVKKIETGRWKIFDNKMVFYDTDGVTPVLTCNLFDEAGLPTMENVFERVPV